MQGAILQLRLGGAIKAARHVRDCRGIWEPHSGLRAETIAEYNSSTDEAGEGKRTIWTDRVASEPGIMLGKSVIRGTRITVEIILKKLGAGIAYEEILRDYPT